MKKLLLLAVLAAASLAQAHENCGYKEVRCATPATTQTVTCPGCPACVCPIEPKVVCKAVAQPVQESYCPEKKEACHRCHKAIKDCRCGVKHHHHRHMNDSEEVTTTKRVRRAGNN